jgi:protocatechuate 3,4-dioxygenase alpha subunit
MLFPTSSQTVGPFFEVGLGWLYTHEIGAAAHSGEHFEIRGRVYDGAGHGVPDALLEIWQADSHGRYAADGAGAPAEFRGFARFPTDANGGFSFRTIKPGCVPYLGVPQLGATGKLQAPHVSVHVFMRGLLLPLHTRVYFPDEPFNADDPVLALVPEARRDSLIARRRPEGFLQWDIRLQGERETVYFLF